MTTAYQASFEDPRRSLATLRALQGHQFVADDVDAASLPTVTSYKDTTDAHLVTWPVECAAITPRAEAKRTGREKTFSNEKGDAAAGF